MFDFNILDNSVKKAISRTLDQVEVALALQGKLSTKEIDDLMEFVRNNVKEVFYLNTSWAFDSKTGPQTALKATTEAEAQLQQLEEFERTEDDSCNPN